MLKINEDQKYEAAKLLLRKENQICSDQDQVLNITGTTTLLGFITLFAYIGFIGQVVIILVMLLECADLNDMYRFMYYRSLMNSMREPIIINIALSTFQAITTSGANPINQNSFSRVLKHARSSMLIN